MRRSFDFVAHFIVQQPQGESDNAELDDSAVAASLKQNLPRIIIGVLVGVEDFHIHQRVVDRLDRHGHMIIMIKQRSIRGRQILRLRFCELATFRRVVVKQFDKFLWCEHDGLACWRSRFANAADDSACVSVGRFEEND